MQTTEASGELEQYINLNSNNSGGTTTGVLAAPPPPLWNAQTRHDELETPVNLRSMHTLPTGATSAARIVVGRSSKRYDKMSRETTKDLRLSRGSKQYVYDEDGVEYLDCFNSTAHVGHSHPQVVTAGQAQMGRLSTAQGFKSDLLSKYVRQLASTLPENLSVVYLCNSGSEANDLALRLARQYTGQEDVVVVDGAFHGNLGVLVDISPKMYPLVPKFKKKDFVHVTPLPNMYRAPSVDKEDNCDTKEATANQFADDAERVIKLAVAQGRGIACFISEPCFVVSGVHFPPSVYYQKVYQSIRKCGALVIADETQSALGRTGKHFWGFQNYGVVPDIVTVGRPLGNGHPLGAVITSKDISNKLGGYFSTFGGNPVSCSMGLAVLEVMYNEKLMSSARNVGNILHGHLVEVQAKYPDWIGDIRGQGLICAIEVVIDADSKSPNPQLAHNIMYGMKEEKILVGLSGSERNVIFFSPPMCFTVENSRRFAKSLDAILSRYKASANIEDESSEHLLARACVSGPIRNTSSADVDTTDHNKQLSDSSQADIHNYHDDDDEVWASDAKRAKIELEEYGELD